MKGAADRLRKSSQTTCLPYRRAEAIRRTPGNGWFLKTGFLFFILMKFIVGKKVAMTQVWKGENVVPVTRIDAGPCTILQQKNVETDGYRAVQLGYGTRRAGLISKPLRGHFKNLGNFRTVREFRLPEAGAGTELKAGDTITVRTFVPGDKLTLVGVSKGKGFQGVVKRHGFHGQDATHGNKDQLRASGSVGAGGVQHVFKGIRMGGRMGGDQVTLHDVEVVSVDESSNSLFVKGAVPGARNSLVLLWSEGELVLGASEPVVEEVVAEEPAEASEEKTDEAAAEETVVAESAPESPAEAAPVAEAPAETPSEEKPSEQA